MNKVMLVGRIANDIRSFTTPSGVNYCRTSIAVPRRSNSTDPITDFIPVVAWRNQADFMTKFLSKGALVAIEGSFTTGSYNGANGLVRTYDVTIENINSLETRQQRETRMNANTQNSNQYSPSYNQNTQQPKFTGSSFSGDMPDFDDEPSSIKHDFALLDDDNDNDLV